jgi:hypothetical protein
MTTECTQVGFEFHSLRSREIRAAGFIDLPAVASGEWSQP